MQSLTSVKNGVSDFAKKWFPHIYKMKADVRYHQNKREVEFLL